VAGDDGQGIAAQIDARGLRRRFLVFDLADDLDPTELRGLPI
jgi:hypothetical protein